MLQTNFTTPALVHITTSVHITFPHLPEQEKKKGARAPWEDRATRLRADICCFFTSFALPLFLPSSWPEAIPSPSPQGIFEGKEDEHLSTYLGTLPTPRRVSMSLRPFPLPSLWKPLVLRRKQRRRGHLCQGQGGIILYKQSVETRPAAPYLPGKPNKLYLYWSNPFPPFFLAIYLLFSCVTYTRRSTTYCPPCMLIMGKGGGYRDCPRAVGDLAKGCVRQTVTGIFGS